MLEELFNVLKNDKQNFFLKCKEGRYVLNLDVNQEFIGDTVEEVLNQAVDWLDINETNSFLDSDISLAKEIHKKGMNEGFKDYAGNDSNKKLAVNYKAFGYVSDGRE